MTFHVIFCELQTCVEILQWLNKQHPEPNLQLDYDFKLPRIRNNYKGSEVEKVLLSQCMRMEVDSPISNAGRNNTPSISLDSQSVKFVDPPPAVASPQDIKPSADAPATAAVAIPESKSPVVAVEALAKVAAVPAPPAMKCGWMKKQGHLIASWKNRYFVLADGNMTYYENASSSAPFGTSQKGQIVLISGTTVAEAKGNNRLYLATPKKGDDLTMEAPSLTERNAWIAALDEHIRYYSKNAPLDSARGTMSRQSSSGSRKSLFG